MKASLESAPSITLSATFSPDDNKLRLRASRRLDADTYARVKAAGFIWAPKQDLFVAPKWTPERADLLIELCGEIDDEDTSLVDRAEERAERFEVYSDRRESEAESARDYVAKIADGIPLGQPILVGHHSERHARKDAQRIENGMRKAVKLWETSKYWERRAKGAIAHAKYKERPEVRARRIKTIEAEQRSYQRALDNAQQFQKMWSTTEPQLTLGRAKGLANLGHTGYGLWSRLDKGELTAEQARDIILPQLAAVIARSTRCAEHCELRLGYERCMLEESGYVAPAKVKSLKETLPLINYRAESISYENEYRRGELMVLPQVEMTKAEYARINKDYKGTRVVERSHKIRTAMRDGGLVCVFLTDSKVHEKPAQGAPPEPPTPRMPRPRVEPPARTDFDAMKDSLKAGVQVVSAPQLFPTPVHVAKRVAELAEIEKGARILEPSAGTGRLIDCAALSDWEWTGHVVAVEQSSTLCRNLRQKYDSKFVTLHEGDFLEMVAADLGGSFDVVLMNPPFANGADIAHILHARAMLKPGGKLVAICANGPRQQAQLMPLASHWEELPDGTFSEQGTNVCTALLVIDG